MGNKRNNSVADAGEAEPRRGISREEDGAGPESRSWRQQLESRVREFQKMESLGRLAGAIAHDFGNIMTAVGCNLHLALRKTGADDPIRSDLEEIAGSIRRAVRLTEQLYQFSRKREEPREETDCNELISSAVEMLQRLIKKNIVFRVELAPEPAMVKACRGELEQILVNLAINARDAMPAGGAFRLAARVERLEEKTARRPAGLPAGDYVVIEAGDAGSGIPEEVLPHIFEPFFTTKKAGEGLGLGLWIVYGNVHRAGGAVVVESSPGKGATFRIFLPRSGETEDDRQPGERGNSAGAGQMGSSGDGCS